MANNPGIPQNRVIASNADSASQPSIQFGGSFDIGSGLGIYADGSSIKLSVGGAAKLTVSATAVTLASGVSLANNITFTSAASVGGTASEALVVTGLLSTDTIEAVTQKTPGANSLPMLGYSTLANNALTILWSADPGAGAIVIVTIKR